MPRFRRRRTRRNGLKRIINQQIARVVGKPELKYWDGGTITASVNASTGAAGRFPQLAQGVTNITRIGEQIRMRSLFVRWGWVNGTSAQFATVCRFIIGVDTQNVGTTPSTAEVLETTDFLSPLNITTTRSRFQILLDKTTTVEPILSVVPTATVALNAAPGSIKFGHKRMMRFPFGRLQHYSGTASTNTFAGTLFYMAISNVASPAPTLYVNLRVRYQDN